MLIKKTLINRYFDTHKMLHRYVHIVYVILFIIKSCTWKGELSDTVIKIHMHSIGYCLG